jgi:hypothetical protein
MKTAAISVAPTPPPMRRCSEAQAAIAFPPGHSFSDFVARIMLPAGTGRQVICRFAPVPGTESGRSVPAGDGVREPAAPVRRAAAARRECAYCKHLAGHSASPISVNLPPMLASERIHEAAQFQ